MRGGYFDSCDLGDEGEHGLDSQLSDSHDEGFTAGLHLLLQFLLAIYLYQATTHPLGFNGCSSQIHPKLSHNPSLVGCLGP